MKGKYDLEIASRKVLYKLVVERKITVIKGNSGTGKTSMIRLLSDYLELGRESGVSVKKSVDFGLKVFRNSTDWETEIDILHNYIVFIDEDVRFLYERGFQVLFQKADCYMVIISRSGMFQQFPFAVNSIYEFRTHLTHKTYITQMYRIYHETFQYAAADCAITEDSNSGHEMMQHIYKCPVYSAEGNSNIIKVLEKVFQEKFSIHVIVDGAAFGGYIEAVLNLGRIKNNIVVYAPESFEYVLLNTTVFRKHLADELDCTWNYCDSTEYLTWERYYTDLLCRLTARYYSFIYSKKKLDSFFINESFFESIRTQLVAVVRRIDPS